MKTYILEVLFRHIFPDEWVKDLTFRTLPGSVQCMTGYRSHERYIIIFWNDLDIRRCGSGVMCKNICERVEDTLMDAKHSVAKLPSDPAKIPINVFSFNDIERSFDKTKDKYKNPPSHWELYGLHNRSLKLFSHYCCAGDSLLMI